MPLAASRRPVRVVALLALMTAAHRSRGETAARRRQTRAAESTARHGGRRVAGGGGGRQGDSAQGRQCCRCGRGDGAGDGGDVSGGRQYRRRRLHGSSSGQGTWRAGRHRLPRNGARRRVEGDVHQTRYDLFPSRCRRPRHGARPGTGTHALRQTAVARGRRPRCPARRERLHPRRHDGQFAELSRQQLQRIS